MTAPTTTPASCSNSIGADLLQEAQGTSAFYDYCATLFLEPIEVPGTQFVVDLAARTRTLVEPWEKTALPGADALAQWARRVQALPLESPAGASEDNAAGDCAREQQQLAADRTFLFRAPASTAPTPPYQAYHQASRAGASENGPSPALARAYADAGVHFAEQRGERDDYLGVQLAFAAYLAAQECIARESGDETRAEHLLRQREDFEDEHLSSWAPAWCAAAASQAHTAFFRAFLILLSALL
ncbi:molecular chaperone TorD family protein [Adlercreutzia sp. R21]|uniref:molecular chaperone TorD family protein n=1 Tax=Adlercreutzia wanghongyangiae TaxID=3111451 RepID=UPI002DB6DF0B|nr:molecular chaperone TorD family protein [Adlercreutzia sp. R21]MEC4184876.1 molecular chaperone TorD family protein [Adlercreutzia sp. R21]